MKVHELTGWMLHLAYKIVEYRTSGPLCDRVSYFRC